MKLLSCFAAVLFLLISIKGQENNIKVSFRQEKYKELKYSYSELAEEKLRLTVTDEQGTPVENLGTQDLIITKNGYQAEIVSVVPLAESQNAKFNIVLCLDNSASMQPHSEKLLKIIDTLLSSFTRGVNITTVFFDNSDREKKFKFNNDPMRIDLREFGSDFEAVKTYCKRLYENELTLKTYIYDQLYTAFTTVNKKDMKAEDIFFIVLSDGVDNASEAGRSDVIGAYKNGSVYLIGFSNQEYSNFLQLLSEKIQAIYYSAQSADELAAKFRQIGKRIVFSGYEVTYREVYPPEITSSGYYQLKSSQYFPVKQLKIEEVRTREFFPLLNYVFFDKNSSLLKDKYSAQLKGLKKRNESFEENNIVPQQLEIYNNLLNIVGSRMQKYPDAKLILTGCNDNEGNEKNNKDLSRTRAEVVKDYIVSNFNIDSQRITVKTGNLPQKNSNTRTQAGQEENRRVEIYSNLDNILGPVEILSNTKLPEPEILNINLNVKSSSPIKNWRLNISQTDKNIFSVEETGLPPVYFSWKIAPSLYDKKLDTTDFKLNMFVTDSKGMESKSTLFSLPINYLSSEKKKAEMLNDRIIEKLSLVLFDFNSSNLDKRNQNILKRVENSITPYSRLKMNGYTDSLGTEEANMKLSKERSSNALKELVKLLKPQTKQLESEGFGEMVELYDNKLPEGRFYNRTCQLVIETPLKVEESAVKVELNTTNQIKR